MGLSAMSVAQSSCCSEDGCCEKPQQRWEHSSVHTQRRIVNNTNPRNLGCNLGELLPLG